MEWNIEIVAGICVAIIFHHIILVIRLIHVEVVAFVLVKQCLTMEFALVLLYVQVQHYKYVY